MVTIQFGLLKTSGQTSYQPEDNIYVLDNTIIGSVTIPQVNKDNLVEYLTSKIGILMQGNYDDDYFAAYTELLSYPTSMMEVRLVEISEFERESFVSRRGFVYNIDDTTMAIRLPFDVPSDNLHSLAVEIGIDLSTETITSLRIFIDAYCSANLADRYTYTNVVITDVVSAGSSSSGSAWTAGDGFREPDNRRYNEDDAVISGVKDLGAQPGWRP